MRRALLIGGALVVIAAGTWVLAHSPARAVASAPASAPERSPAEVELREPVHEKNSSARQAVEPASATKLGAPETGERPAAGWTGPTLVVHVIDESERPVADVPLRFVDLGAAYVQAPELVNQGYDFEALSARLGTSFVSDAQGLARVPRPPVGGIVTGARDGVSGVLFFDHDFEGQEASLVVREERELRVHVVDAAGSPAAGVCVALRTRDGRHVRDIFKATTGSDGTTRIGHLQEAFENGIVPGDHLAVSVALALLAREPVEAVLPPGPLPGAALELVLPPLGSLEIQLEGPDGRPLDLDARVGLALGSADEDREGGDFWDRYARSAVERCQAVFVRGGRARVDAIGLGLTLEAEVEPSSGYRPSRVRIAGPRTAGERAVARLPVTEHLATLDGTLRGPDGSPYGSRNLRTRLWLESDEGGRGAGPALRTDEAGRFALEIDGGWPLAGRYTLELWCDEPDGRRWWRREEWQAELAPGENVLGPWTIEPLPILAAGRVVGESGAPIAGAIVRLRNRPDGFRQGWVDSTRTRPDGAFALQGAIDPREVEFEVHHDGFVSRTLSVPTGSTDLVVRLGHGGGLAGRVLVADERALPALEVVAVQNGEVRQTCALEDDGSFALADLEPGLYDVALHLPVEPEFSFVVPGVAVAADEKGDDARLQAIDLRAALRTFGLTLVHPAGETTLWTFVRRRPAGTEKFADADDWSLEDPTFTTSHPALDLRISVEDCRTVELLGVAEDREVELQAAFAVAVTLSPPVALGEEEWLELKLSSREGAPLPKLFGPRFFDGQSLETALPEPGDYDVRLNFLQQAVHDLRSTHLPLEPGAVLHVLERDEPQRFTIALPPAALAAIERARADPPPRAK